MKGVLCMDRKRSVISVIGAVFFAVLSIIFGIGIGSVYVPPSSILSAISVRLFGDPMPEGLESTTVNIIMDLRMPRVILAFLTGAALSASGAAVQSVLRNPLASPYTLGVSSGASLGAGIVIAAGFTFLGQFTLAAAGLASALLTMFAAVAFTSRIDKSFESSTIVLTGMVISLFISAIVNLMANLADEKYKQILKWQTGSFSGRGWGYCAVLAVVSVICIAVYISRSRELDLMSFGDEQAASAGIDPAKTRRFLLIVMSVLTGTAVAFSGVIGFIDMIAPQIVRRIFGAKHSMVIPMSAIVGGTFMVICDIAARTLTAPSELPVGTVTALIGAPFFAYVFFRRRKKA